LSVTALKGYSFIIEGIPLFICNFGFMISNYPLTKEWSYADGLFFCYSKDINKGDFKLARSNYQFRKRQKELAKKEKKELKRQRKIEQKTDEIEIEQDQTKQTTEPTETA